MKRNFTPHFPSKPQNPVLPKVQYHVLLSSTDAAPQTSKQTEEEIQQIKNALEKTNSLLRDKALPKKSIASVGTDNITQAGCFSSISKGYFVSDANGKKFLDENIVILKKIKLESLKLIYPSKVYVSPEEEKLFLARHILWEMTGLNSVSHPNIITCYGTHYPEDDSSPDLVLEYCPNGNLCERLKGENSILSAANFAERWKLAYQIAQGLSYIHRNGLVHCDLRTPNILLDREDNAKIGDFGIVSIDSLLLEPGVEAVSAPLSLQSAPPEAYYDKEASLSKRCDIYALGIVFWELLTGKEPTKRRTSDLSWLQDPLREKIPPECLETEQGKFFAEIINDCWPADPKKSPDIELIVEKLQKNGALFHPKAACVCLAQELASQFYPPNQKPCLNYQSLKITSQPIGTNTLEEAEEASSIEEGFKKLFYTPSPASFSLNDEPRSCLLTGEAGSGKSSTIYQLGREALKKCWAWITTNESSSPTSMPPWPILIAKHTAPIWSFKALENCFNNFFIKKLSLLKPFVDDIAINIPWIIIVDGVDELMNEPLNNLLDLDQNFVLSKYLGIPSNQNLMITWRISSAQTQSFYDENCYDKFFNNVESLTKFHILPYSQIQALHYLKQSLNFSLEDEDYYKKIMEHSHVKALLTNPLILKLLSKIWKTIVNSNIHPQLLTRWHIYEAYTKQCFYQHETLFSVNIIKKIIQEDTNNISIDDLVTYFIKTYMGGVALKIFNKGGALSDTGIVDADDNWSRIEEIFQEERKKEFDSQEHKVRYLEKENYLELKRRELNQFLAEFPLRYCSGRYEFLHKTFLDFAIVQVWVDLATLATGDIVVAIKDAIPTRLITEQDEILEFWQDAWRANNLTKLIEPFFSKIEESKEVISNKKPRKNTKKSNAGKKIRKHENAEDYLTSNLATLLATAKVPFSGRNLEGVNIRGANLRGVICDKTNFGRANLRNVSFVRGHLKYVNLSGADATNASFNDTIEVLVGEQIKVVFMHSFQKFWVGTEDGKILGYEYSETGYECKTKLKVSDAPILCIKEAESGELYAATKYSIVILEDTGNTFFVNSQAENNVEISGFFIECERNHLIGDIVLSHSMENNEAQIIITEDFGKTNQKKINTGYNDEIIKMASDISTLITIHKSNKLIVWKLAELSSDLSKIDEFEIDYHDKGRILHVYFTSDGKDAVIICENAIFLLTISTCYVETKDIREAKIVCAEYDEDRDLLFTGHDDNLIRVWDLKNDSCKLSHRIQDKIIALSYCSDKQLLVVADANTTISLLSTKMLTLKSYGNQHPITNMIYCGEGHLAAGDTRGQIWVWNLLTGNPVRYYDATGRVTSLAYSGSNLAVGTFNEFKLFDLKEKKVKSLQYTLADYNAVSFLTFPNPHQILEACGKNIKVIELDRTKIPTDDSMVSLEDNVQLLNTACINNKIILFLRHEMNQNNIILYSWDLTHGKSKNLEHISSLHGHNNKVTHAIFCNDILVATASMDNTVRLWNITKTENVNSTLASEVRIITSSEVSALAFSDAILAIVNKENQITLSYIFDRDKNSSTLSTVEPIQCITFCKGAMLAAGSGYDIYVWAKVRVAHEIDWMLIHRLGGSLPTSLFAKYVCLKNTRIADNIKKPLKKDELEVEPKIISYSEWWAGFWSRAAKISDKSNKVISLESDGTDEDEDEDENENSSVLSDEEENSNDSTEVRKKLK